MRRLLLAAYFLEVGLLLLVLPWSSFWDDNYLLEAVPQLHELARSPWVRGAVSGVGLLNLGLGIAEVAEAVSARFGGRRPDDGARIAGSTSLR